MEIGVPSALVITYRNGKVVRFEDVVDRRKALEAVGLSEQDAHAFLSLRDIAISGNADGTDVPCRGRSYTWTSSWIERTRSKPPACRSKTPAPTPEPGAIFLDDFRLTHGHLSFAGNSCPPLVLG